MRALQQGTVSGCGAQRWALVVVGLVVGCALPQVGPPGVAAAGTGSHSHSTSISESASISESPSSSPTPTASPSLSRFDHAMHLSCPANVTAGTVLTCNAVVTFNDAPLGSEACLVALNVCGATTMHFNNATLVADGTFRFAFVPTVADRLFLTASFNGTALSANATVVVKPAAIVLSGSDSKCTVVDALGTTSTCTAYWRDRFGNVAKTCNTTYVNGAASDQTTAVCSVL